jgi:hypothetical protein
MFQCSRFPNGEYDCQVDYPSSDTYCCKLWENRTRKLTSNIQSSHPEYYDDYLISTIEKIGERSIKTLGLITDISNKFKWSAQKNKKKETDMSRKRSLYSYE